MLNPTERVTHLVLSMTGVAYVALLVAVLLSWADQSTALRAVSYGNNSSILTLPGVGVFARGIRDFVSGLKLSNLPETASRSVS